MSAKFEEKVAPAAAETPAVQEKQPEPATDAVATPAPVAEAKDETIPTEKLAELSIAGDKAPVSAEEAKVIEATGIVASAPIPSIDGPADTTASTKESSGPVWPETGPDHPLTKLYELVPQLVKEADHSEVYGITLSHDAPFHTKLILQKFLRANSNDLTKAKEQLLETLKWRKEFDPIAAAKASYDKEAFGGLGYITEIEGVPESPNAKDVVTFNIYGAVKDNQKTFGDLEAFLKWRVGLMEHSVQKLRLQDATKPIPNFGEGVDPYQGFQVHDYLSVSFMRQEAVVKTATKKTIETLSRFYPETLSRKFFVNVPFYMRWIYNAVTAFVAKETKKKFTILTYGEELAGDALGKGAPKEYGGEAGPLAEVGEGVRLKEKEDKGKDKVKVKEEVAAEA